MIPNKTIYNIVISLLICSISGVVEEITIINPAPLNPQEVAGTAVLEDGSRGCIMFANLSKDPTPVTIVGVAGPLPGARIEWIRCFDIDNGEETAEYAELEKQQELQIHLPEQGYVSVITFVRETAPEYLTLEGLHNVGINRLVKSHTFLLEWIQFQLYNILQKRRLTKTEFNKTKAYLNGLHEEFKDHPELVTGYFHGRIMNVIISSVMPMLNLMKKQIKTPNMDYISFELTKTTAISQQEIEACQELKERLGLSTLSIGDIRRILILKESYACAPGTAPKQIVLKMIQSMMLEDFIHTLSIDPQSLETEEIVREHGGSIIGCESLKNQTHLSSAEIWLRLALLNGYKTPLKLTFVAFLPENYLLTTTEQELMQEIKAKYGLEFLSDKAVLSALTQFNYQAFSICVQEIIAIEPLAPYGVFSKTAHLAFAGKLPKDLKELKPEDVKDYELKGDYIKTIDFHLTQDAYRTLEQQGKDAYYGNCKSIFFRQMIQSS